MSCEGLFIKELRERGLRMTPQREMVLNALHALADHATVDEIHRRVQAVSTVVDVSTVYRTLELLAELRMLSTVDGMDGQKRFALVGVHGDHVHLVCSGCGRVEGISPYPVDVLALALRSEHGFHLDRARVTLVGRCAACSATGTHSRAS